MSLATSMCGAPPAARQENGVSTPTRSCSGLWWLPASAGRTPVLEIVQIHNSCSRGRACRWQMTVVPAGMGCPSSSSSADRWRTTTGTTEYFRSDSCRRILR